VTIQRASDILVGVYSLQNDPESVIEPEWFERLEVCRPRGMEEILASFTSPRPPPPPPPEEEEEEEEHEEESKDDKLKKKGEKGKKADPAAEEAERQAKLEAKARRKAEAEARLAEEMAVSGFSMDILYQWIPGT
jgi:hypothetical protein